ncbi:MAG TPA: sel1 repeat family protein [Candidatus Competibacteraceae bacterium]|nr:sel1 repeat family protein [Candidatus Competibacteraceae bacterium]
MGRRLFRASQSGGSGECVGLAVQGLIQGATAARPALLAGPRLSEKLPCSAFLAGCRFQNRGFPLPMWFRALIVLLWLGVASPGQADYLAGMLAFARGDYLTALVEWRPPAEQGQAEAQFNLGVLYDGGLGVERDYRQAARWYQRAAEQGHAKAQFNLAVLFANGLGVERDMEEAARWYRQAAIQDEVEAQFNLGVLYEDGAGVVQSDVAAAYWYRLAAYQGHTMAQNNLGILFANGRGMSRDPVAAYAWYALAAKHRNLKARSNRDRLAGLLTPQQLAEGERMAAEFEKRYRSWPRD